jgi:hypothetical protein
VESAAEQVSSTGESVAQLLARIERQAALISEGRAREAAQDAVIAALQARAEAQDAKIRTQLRLIDAINSGEAAPALRRGRPVRDHA